LSLRFYDLDFVIELYTEDDFRQQLVVTAGKAGWQIFKGSEFQPAVGARPAFIRASIDFTLASSFSRYLVHHVRDEPPK
jgi:hypothetical protein